MNERKLFRALLVVNLVTFIFIPLSLLLLYNVRAILSPILSALLLAYLLYPVVALGNRFGIPKVLMVLGVVTLLIGSTVLIGFSLKPALQEQLRFLFENTQTTTPPAVSTAEQRILDTLAIETLPPDETSVTIGPDDASTTRDDANLDEDLEKVVARAVAKEFDEAKEDTEEIAPDRMASNRLQQIVDRFLNTLRKRGWLTMERSALLAGAADFIARESLGVLRSFTQVAVQWGRFLMIFFFVLIFALLDGDKLQKTIVQLIPNEFFESSVFVLHKTQQILGAYLRGLFVENLIIFVVAFCLMLPLRFINGIPLLLVLVVAAIIAITNVIRIIGPIIGGIIGVILALTATTDLTVLGGIIVVAVIVQLLDNVLILPLVMRDQVAIHPVVCLLGVIAGGILAGVLGMILAIPVIGGIKVLYRVMSIEMKRFVEPGQYEDYTRE